MIDTPQKTESELNRQITALALARAKHELAVFERTRSKSDILVRFTDRVLRLETDEKEAKAAHERAMAGWISAGALGESPPYVFDEEKLRDARIAVATQKKVIDTQSGKVEKARQVMAAAEKAVRLEAERVNKRWEEEKLAAFCRIVEEQLIPLARVMPFTHDLDRPINVSSTLSSVASNRVLEALRMGDDGLNTPVHLLRSGASQYSATPDEREARIAALCEGKSI